MVSSRRAAVASSLGNLCVLARTPPAEPDLPITQLRPTTLEIDLIFPRPGETFLRVTPFPVVFAIQGPAPYGRELYKTKLSDDPDKDERYTQRSVPGGDDPFYWISFSSLMAPVMNSTSTNYHLTWTAHLPDNCTRNADDIDYSDEPFPPAFLGLSGSDGGEEIHRYRQDPDRSPVIEGLARFHVADDGSMEVGPPSDDWCPDVESTLAPLPPSFPASRLLIGTTNTLRVAGTATEDRCLFFADDAGLRPEPNPCAARPASALAAEVTRRMADVYECAEDKKVWPPPPEGYSFEQPDYCIPTPAETFETCGGGGKLKMFMETAAVIASSFGVGMLLL